MDNGASQTLEAVILSQLVVHTGMDMAAMGMVMVTAMGTLLSHSFSHIPGTCRSIAVLLAWPCVSMLAHAVVVLLLLMLLLVVIAFCVCSHMAVELRLIGALSRPIE